MASIEQLLEAVLRGNSICFTGAGFSVDATDATGSPVPSTIELIEELKDIANLDAAESASLADIAEFYESNRELSPKLNLHIQKRLTVTRPSDSQSHLASLPWRSIFTTNFDDIIERTLHSSKYYPVSPSSVHIDPPDGLVPLYYLHGRAMDLLESSIDPKIVISETNYVKMPVQNKVLYQRLLNEIYLADALIVIGYSIRDLEIARNFISANPSLSEKTLIITSPTDGIIATNRLKKYGHVRSIGLAGFLDELKALGKPNEYVHPEILSVQPPLDAQFEPNGDEFLSLVVRGMANLDALAYQINRPEDDAAFCVFRNEKISQINRPDRRVDQFFVLSDFGNGKSFFLDQVSVSLSLSGYDIYRINTNAPELADDISIINSNKRKSAFIVDDSIRYRTVVESISSTLPRGSLLVCSLRADPADRIFDDVTSRVSGDFEVIDINLLSDTDLEKWDSLLERWGYWEENIALSAQERIKFLKNNCGSENRSIILSIFESSRIAQKIDDLVTFFVADEERRFVFAAMLIASLCQQHVPWDRLVDWLEIDEQKLRKDLSSSELSSLFRGEGNWNAFTSSQLAAFILKRNFIGRERDILLDVYSEIVLATADSASDGYLGRDSAENLKELMKFRFLARLFGDDDGAAQLIASVYKRLSKAPYIRENPQFWLQFAMSRMEIGDLHYAETYLKTALGLAEKRGRQYSPFQILDQRARLYFLKNCVQGKAYSIIEINTAIRDLIELSLADRYDAIYPFRAIRNIEEFLECHCDDLDDSTKSLLNSLFGSFSAVAAEWVNLPKSVKGETKVLYESLERCKAVLSVS